MLQYNQQTIYFLLAAATFSCHMHAPVQASCALCYLVCRAVELSILLWHAGIPDGCYAMSAALQKVPKAQAASGPPLPHLQQVSFYVAACCAHAQAQTTRVRSHM